jgi:tetratricopeptide (TPR) repeat protein
VTSWQKPRVVVQLINGMTGEVIGGREFPQETVADLLSDKNVRAIADYVRSEVGRYSRAQHIAAFSPADAETIHRASESRALADSLREDGEVQQALAAYDAADSLLASIKAGRRAAAMALAERAQTWFARAWVFLTPGPVDLDSFQNNARRAVTLADSAIALEPQAPLAFEMRGAAMQMLWQFAPRDSVALLKRFMEMSESSARTAVALAPARARSWALLAGILYVQGRYDEAMSTAQRAYAVNAFLEGSADVVYRLFSSAIEIGDMPKATAWCEEVGRRFPNTFIDTDCRLQLLAWSKPSREQFRQATLLVAKHKARQTGPDQLVTRLEMDLGIVAAAAGLPVDSALAIQNQAIAASPDDPELAPARAWFWRTVNRPDSLRSVLDSYISADPIRRGPLVKSRRFRLEPIIAATQGLQYQTPLTK